MKHLFFFIFCCALLVGCDQKQTNTSSTVKVAAASNASAPFKLPVVTQTDQYWYQGKAELAVYNVEQGRYGEMREAEQVMIFVTEDFSQKKQVKLDNAPAAGDDRVPVLKLNSVRRFKTGIYDYSIMQSTFVPTDGAPALKSTTTVQDWCGQTFTQLNTNGSGTYRLREFSYFESEGDTDAILPKATLEDELWIRMRLDPTQVKTGKQMLIPNTIHHRFKHTPYIVEPADVQLARAAGEITLQVVYANIPRSLAVTFEDKAPYRLLRWEEKDNDKIMSKGTLRTLRLEPYWEQNSNKFNGMRDSLLLK